MKHADFGLDTALIAAERVLSIRGNAGPADVPGLIWTTEGVQVPTTDGQFVNIVIDQQLEERPPTAVEPGVRVFEDVAPEADVVARTSEAGLRLVTVLRGPEAPAEYRFRLTLAEGHVLERMPSGGYDIVHERYGASVGRLFAPWASDSLYQPIPANYRLEEDMIVMTVNHDGATYPVVVDPLFGRP